MKAAQPIGILGGMGPQAGIDLASKLVAHTRATKDQDHIPSFLYGDPSIPDRTQFLFGHTTVNPAHHMVEGVQKLYALGVKVVGVACNTAHSPGIFDEFKSQLRSRCPDLTIIHLIEETVAGIQSQYPHIKNVGVLGTEGTLRFKLYDNLLVKAGLNPIQPRHQDALTPAIFDPKTGIKACSSPVHGAAVQGLVDAIEDVVAQGAEVVILGCTELPLAVPSPTHNLIPLLDPAVFLARALIQAAAPDRLLPWRV